MSDLKRTVPSREELLAHLTNYLPENCLSGFLNHVCRNPKRQLNPANMARLFLAGANENQICTSTIRDALETLARKIFSDNVEFAHELLIELRGGRTSPVWHEAPHDEFELI